MAEWLCVRRKEGRTLRIRADQIGAFVESKNDPGTVRFWMVASGEEWSAEMTVEEFASLVVPFEPIPAEAFPILRAWRRAHDERDAIEPGGNEEEDARAFTAAMHKAHERLNALDRELLDALRRVPIEGEIE